MSTTTIGKMFGLSAYKITRKLREWGIRVRAPGEYLKGFHMPKETRQKQSEAQRGEKSHTWKGGRVKTAKGYIRIWLHPGDFFYPMTQENGYVYEHRLVMAKHLGRCLQAWEIVHHKEGVARDDNKIEGLQLVTDDRHRQITILENRIRQLREENTKLQTELELAYNKGKIEMHKADIEWLIKRITHDDRGYVFSMNDKEWQEFIK